MSLLKYPPRWPWQLSTLALLALSGSSSEQQLWFPNQNVQDPDTLTLPHLIQLKQEYKKLVEDFNCDLKEFMTVQGPPAPPSKILLLPPLTRLHSATMRNMELPQPGEP